MHTHITYYATYQNTIIYIGSGAPTRYKHVTSGTSHVYGLNQLHFLEPGSVSVHILKGYETAEEALKEEEYLIKKFKPAYNTQWIEGEDKEFLDECEILKYQGPFIRLTTGTQSIIDKVRYKAATNFKDLGREYIDALQRKDEETRILIENYDNIFKECYEIFKEDIETELSAASFQRKRLETRLQNQLACNSNNLKSSIHSIFKVNKLYTLVKIKETLAEIYKKEGIKKSPTATILNEYFKTIKTKDSKGNNCFKIISKI